MAIPHEPHAVPDDHHALAVAGDDHPPALAVPDAPAPATPSPASPASTPSASTRSFQIAPARPSSAPRTPRPGSARETFSAPPILPRALGFHSPGPSLSQLTDTSAASAVSRPSTAASSALALAPHLPGIASSVPLVLPACAPIDDADPLGPRKQEALLQSHLLTGPVPKPWLAHREPRVRASYFITLATAFLGLLASAVVCFFGYRSVPLITQPLCLVLQDDFDSFSVDTPGATWRREVDLGGFGNGQFEMATAAPENSFVRDGKLYIVPTLTADTLPGGNASVFDGHTFNATGCTSPTNLHGTACGAVSNATAGTIINPVQSARLTTQRSHAIQYGKVEIRARAPKGDWLWPALWMLPVNETYGPWPLSGEIDIMEARGNAPAYPMQGSNYVRGSLNWGPAPALNAVFRTYGWWLERRASYADAFHTYTLEWTQDFLRIYVDTRLHRMVDLRFNTPFFARGAFPPTIQNNSQTVALQNPWLGRGNSAPFDKPFFLILDVAVGGTNGWFPDNAGGKPWVDGSATAMRDFALAQADWYPTWPKDVEQRALVVDYVKMWQLC